MQNFEFCVKRTLQSKRELVTVTSVSLDAAKKHVAEDFPVWVYRPNQLASHLKPWLE